MRGPRGVWSWLVGDADVPPRQQETLDAEEQVPSSSPSARQEGEQIELLDVTVYSAGGTELFHDGAVDPSLEIGAFRELVAAAMQQTVLASADLQAFFVPAQAMALALQRPKTVPVLLVPSELREKSLAALFGSFGSGRLELSAIMDTESFCRAVACRVL